MAEPDVIRFLKENITPVQDIYGLGYRISAYLEDKTYLPCVIFRNISEKKRWHSGKVIDCRYIKNVEFSPFALPADIEKMIIGETAMGYTGFVGRMKDGKIFGFGTSFETQFFEMPNSYTATDIKEIINHSFVDHNGGLRLHKIQSNNDINWNDLKVYRELPYFECYLNEL